MKNKKLALAAIAFCLLATTPPAEARPRHHHHHARHHRVVAAAPQAQAPSFWNWGGGGGSGVISEMRRYMGGNPTGWARVWCGVFLDMALRATGHQRGSAAARDYARYGRPARGPAPGAIVVWPHHVGVVTAVQGGNIQVISGNDGHRVRERLRTTAGVIAYRWP
jgi:uncharacterized protein (TIGR02594 family)